MPTLNLSIDELLTTTRAVRKRLDLTRPVERAVILECLSLAVQAPTPGSMQNWHFIIVTDPEQRARMGALYRKGAAAGGQEQILQQLIATAANPQELVERTRMADAALHLTAHIHAAPVHIIPCLEGRIEQRSHAEQAAYWGGIWPATWSFMLAARSRGLGTVLTTLHLDFEQEAAEVLGIDYTRIMQVGLIPLAYTLGTTFHPAQRKPLEQVVHWDRWAEKTCHT
jgi:nitroreductase